MDKCTKCKVKWNKNQKWIECEYCNSGFHIKCAGITAQKFTLLSGCDQSHWFCSTCNGKVKDLIGSLKNIEKQNNELKKAQDVINSKVSSIITGEDLQFVSTVKEIVAEVGIEDYEDSERKTKSLINEGLKEMNNRRMKETNVVTYGVTDDLAK